MAADLSIAELRTRAERARISKAALDELAASGHAVRQGACTSHRVQVCVLTQTRHDGRWGEIRMLAPGQVKLNWVDGGGGEFVAPDALGDMRIVREDLLDERMGLADLIAHASVREGNVQVFAQWVEGGDRAIVNSFAVWAEQATAARAAKDAAEAKAIEDARERAEQEAAARDVFGAIDTDGSGGLDMTELKVLLSRLGEQKVTKKKLAVAMDQMDLDGDGDISMDEFIVWWCALDGDQRALVVEAQAEAVRKAEAKAAEKKAKVAAAAASKSKAGASGASPSDSKSKKTKSKKKKKKKSSS